MPHVIVKMYPGRTNEDKAKLAELLAQAVMTGLGSPERAVSVSIEDVAPEAWTETVYKPEIEGKPDILFKKPGYSPS